MSAPARCHRPVGLSFHAALSSLKALHFRAAADIPRQLVFGPQLPEQPFRDEGGPLQMILTATNLLERGFLDEAFRLRDASYIEWAARSEEELARRTGVDLPARHARTVRGSFPTLVWKPLVHNRGRKQDQYTSIAQGGRAWHWLAQVASQCVSMVAKWHPDPQGRHALSS